jgi:hypothetical protein
MAPRKQNDDGYIYDAVTTFEGGMNAGVEPLLLPKTQAAFATNVSFRGGFIGNRAAMRKITLDYGGDLVLQALVEQKGFQGACFYNSDFGTQHLVASIGGRLFQFTSDPANLERFSVIDVSIPGDTNPENAPQAWLIQAERWVIVDDGMSLPLFFDGSSTRRSFGPSQLLTTVAGAGFTAPAVGAAVTTDVAGVYSGPFNIPVLVSQGGNEGVYTIQPPTPGPTLPNARLQVIYIPGGTFNPLQLPSPHFNVPIGSQVFSIPSRVGVAYTTVAPSATVLAQVGLTNPPNNQEITFFSFASDPSLVPLGTWIMDSKTYNVNLIDDVNPQPSFDFFYRSFGEAPVPFVSNFKNDFVINTNNPNPNTLVGTLQQAFTTPDRLSTIDVILDIPYTGADNQPVWIDNQMYLVSKIPPPAPTSQVNLLNQTDTPGTAYTAGATISTIAELPAGRMGAYGMGRVWLSLVDGRSFMAGDIVGGSSGSTVYQFRDAVLKSTENSFLAGGGNFVVPGSVGDIRAMIFEATLDASLGQGPLQVAASRTVFSCNTPVDRTVWQSITNPILTESLRGAGATGQNSTVNSNGDTVFRAIDGIRSLILGRREFDTWGNVPQSREVEPILKLDNKSLLQYGSAIVFDNRLLMSCFPQSGPRGVFHNGLIALNFDEISSLRGKAPSIYDGLWTGLNVLQMVTGVFNGVERAYAFCFNSRNFNIELFEILPSGDGRFDNDQGPITMSFETPVFFRPKYPEEMQYYRLEGGEIAVSDLVGVVNFQVWFRSDDNQCWTPWANWTVCGDNLNSGDIPQYRPRMGFGQPTSACDNVTNRPLREGYYFQLRIQIAGSCKVKRIKLAASAQPEPELAPLICNPICTT